MPDRLQITSNGVEGSGGLFGGGTPTTAKDTLFATSYASVVEVLSEGPIVGLVNGANSIFFNGTPMMDTKGTANFENCSVGFRFGLPDQAYLPGWSDVATETSVGVEVTVKTGAVIRTTLNQNADTLRVTIRIGQLMYQDSNGNVKGTSVQFAIDYQPVGSTGWWPFPGSPFTINGKTSSGYDAQYAVHVQDPASPALQLYNIRVTRITADPATDNTTVANSFTFFSFAEIISQQFTYPDTAYIGLQLPSTSFNGGVPARTYDVYGRIIRIPANYDPLAKTYTGLWDGSFNQAWTDNPAWILFDLLTNNRFGLGLTDAQVDIAALYTIGQYCDQPVPDGFGGTEPRYTINICINSQTEAYDLINKLIATFQTMSYYSSGLVTFSQDSPRSTDMILAPANVVDGMFTYSSQSYRDTANTILVSWLNPAIQNKGDIETVESLPDVIARGQVTKKIDGYGVLSRGFARRLGRWALYTSLLDTDTVTYAAGLDHAGVMPGNIIEIHDPSYDGLGLAGRVMAIEGGPEESTITLDRPVTITTAMTLSLVATDLKIQTYPVLTAIGPDPTSQITVAGTVYADNCNCVWALTAVGATPRLYRVITKKVSSKSTYEITALSYHPDKYALIESGLQIDPDLYSDPLAPSLEPPTDFSIQEFMDVSTTGVAIESVLLSWKASPDPSVSTYRAQVFKDSSWTTVALSAVISAEVQNLPAGTNQFRIRGEANDGRVSPWLLATATIIGVNPIAILDFDATQVDVPDGNGGKVPGIQCTWDPLYQSVVQSVVVEYYPDGRPDLVTQITFTPPTVGVGVIAGLSAQTTYILRARPLVSPAQVAVSWSEYVSVTTGNIAIYIPLDVAPDVPTGLTLVNTVRVNTDGSIIAGVAASWIDVTAPTFLSYEVQILLPGAEDWASIQTGRSSYQWWGLQIGSTVLVRVASRSRLGAQSTFSDTATLQITGSTVSPDNPTGLEAASGFKVISLTWVNPVNPDLNYIEIYRSITPDLGDAALIGAVSAMAYIDGSNVVTGVTYYYWIRAVNSSGLKSAYAPPGAGVSATPGQIDGRNDIVTGSILADALAAGSITASKLAAGAITADTLGVTQLSAITADVGRLTSGSLESEDEMFIIDLTGRSLIISDG